MNRRPLVFLARVGTVLQYPLQQRLVHGSYRLMAHSVIARSSDRDADAPKNEVTGKPSIFRTSIVIDKHMLVADEPVRAQGCGEGPNPYDYLLAGLGSCTTMTIKMYAERKGLALEGVSVLLSHRKVDPAGGSDASAAPGAKVQKIDQFERKITLHGEGLTPEQRKRIIEIANKTLNAFKLFKKDFLKRLSASASLLVISSDIMF